MIEFGSDFHRCDKSFIGDYNIEDFFKGLRYYASGRLAIDALLLQEKWTRIWIPAYFCYEVIEHIKSSGIYVNLYEDFPLNNNSDLIVRTLPYKDGDVLLRMNYFGIRGCNDNNGIPVPVIEDHTHSLISDCAIHSNADWCIASVRKSVPIAAGGILWSPKGLRLPNQLLPSSDCELMSMVRYSAMNMKADYLNYGGDKDLFRCKYLQSEYMIEHLKLSGIDNESYNILQSFDINKWTLLRRDNWESMINNLDERFHVLRMSEFSACPFSVVIYTKSPEERSSLKRYLIENNIYPAILWSVPEETSFRNVLDFSQRMISIHCDPRYSKEEILQMCRTINSYYD